MGARIAAGAVVETSDFFLLFGVFISRLFIIALSWYLPDLPLLLVPGHAPFVWFSRFVYISISCFSFPITFFSLSFSCFTELYSICSLAVSSSLELFLSDLVVAVVRFPSLLVITWFLLFLSSMIHCFEEIIRWWFGIRRDCASEEFLIFISSPPIHTEHRSNWILEI